MYFCCIPAKIDFMDKQLHILIVDPKQALRQAMRYLLYEIGHEQVVEAANSAEAIDLLVNEYSLNKSIDLVISDYDLPDMNGIDFYNVLKNGERFNQIPFMLVTNNSEKEFILDIQNAGIRHVMLRPFDINNLRKEVEEILGPIENSTEEK